MFTGESMGFHGLSHIFTLHRTTAPKLWLLSLKRVFTNTAYRAAYVGIMVSKTEVSQDLWTRREARTAQAILQGDRSTTSVLSDCGEMCTPPFWWSITIFLYIWKRMAIYLEVCCLLVTFSRKRIRPVATSYLLPACNKQVAFYFRWQLEQSQNQNCWQQITVQHVLTRLSRPFLRGYWWRELY